jgi:hypothetical protein
MSFCCDWERYVALPDKYRFRSQTFGIATFAGDALELLLRSGTIREHRRAEIGRNHPNES